MFHRGFKHSKTIKARLRPRAFISFLVFETPMKHSHSFLKYYFSIGAQFQTKEKKQKKEQNWRTQKSQESTRRPICHFSSIYWDEGKTITKEMKTAHSLTNCKACTTLKSNLQATLPLGKKCMTVKKGPLNEIQRNANKHTTQHRVQKGSKITNKQLKVFYFTYDDKCKENFGKSLSEILVLVS